MSDIDALGGVAPPEPAPKTDDDGDSPKPGAEPAAPAAPAEPEGPQPPAEPEKAKADDAGLAPPDQVTPRDGKPVKARALREELARSNTELADLRAKLEEASGRLKQFGDHKVEDLLGRIKTLEGERDEIRKELSFTAYERSPQFKTDYVAPITRALQDAYTDLAELTVLDPSTQEERPVTNEEFLALVQMPLRKAAAAAKELFGEDLAPMVMNHRTKIVALDRRRGDAIEEYRKNHDSIEKERQTRSATQREEQNRAWQTVNNEFADKFPAYFKSDKDDPEGSKALETGYGAFDAAMNPQSPLTPDQRMRTLAAVRHKSAGFDRVALRVNKLQSRVNELEEALAEYEDSDPKGGKQDAGGGKAGERKAADPNLPKGYRTFDEEIDDLVRT